MKAPVDKPTRVASDLMDDAAAEGRRQSRSAKQQLDHWARVGRAMSLPATAARIRIESALAGRIPLSQLMQHERAVYDAEVDAAISEDARAISFGSELARRGVTTVAIDADGVLHQYNPDGTSHPLD